MADLLQALGVVVLVVLATISVSIALVVRALTRANAVAPGRRSPAPLAWLVSPRLPARLHRRLRQAVAVGDFATGAMAPAALALTDVARELRMRAISLDDWLVAATGLHPVARRARLARLAAEVRDVEMSAARLHDLCADWRHSLDQAAASAMTPIPDLHQRLDAVEAALRELPLIPATPAAVARPRR